MAVSTIPKELTFFNLGSSSPSTTNFNAFVTPGIRTVSMSGMTNAPRSTGTGSLFILYRGDSTERVFQMIFIYDSNDGKVYAYLRSQSGASTWTNWKELTA